MKAERIREDRLPHRGSWKIVYPRGEDSRFLSLWIVLLSLLFCSHVFAYSFAGGTGEPNDPYQITTAEQLISIGDDPNLLDKCYVLINDIDMDPNLPGGQVFDRAVIAPDMNDADPGFQGTAFNGCFDGQSFTIMNLIIDSNSTHAGLFAIIGKEGIVRNVCLVESSVRGESPGQGGRGQGSSGGTGGLASENQGLIQDCYCDVIVKGNHEVGGLVGVNSGTVSNSYSTGAVSGEKNVGGLIGGNGGIGIVSNCYSMSLVNGTDSVGGLVGSHTYNIISKCYSTGSVSGTGQFVGGLVGFSVLGFGTISNCIWDIATSGQTGSDGGAGLTTAEMMDPNMLALNGFGGDPNWIVDARQDYPRLTWQGTEGHPIAEPVIDWLPGHGTEEDPYCINQSDQLIKMSKASILWDKHLLLCEDIDLDPNLPGRYIFNQALIPNFSGIFEGDGHVISCLTIRGSSPLGLFGQLDRGAEIRNLGLVNVNIKGTHIAGGLVGYSSGIVENSYCTGLVAGGYWAVGGLVGINFGNVLNSYTNCSVSGTECVGGLTGDSYSMIMNSYSVGPVSGTFVGGLTCGDYYTVSSSFWDTETSGVPAWDGSMGLTTAEMQEINTYLDAGWDFNDIWSICEGQDYPRLQWEQQSCSED